MKEIIEFIETNINGKTLYTKELVYELEKGTLEGCLLRPDILFQSQVFAKRFSIGYVYRIERKDLGDGKERTAGKFKKGFQRLKAALSEKTESVASYKNHFEKLKTYFIRQRKLLQGFEKNPAKLKEFTDTLTDWIETLGKILKLLSQQIGKIKPIAKRI